MTLSTLINLVSFAREHIRDEPDRIMYYLKFIELLHTNGEFLPEEMYEAIPYDRLLKRVLDEYRTARQR